MFGAGAVRYAATIWMGRSNTPPFESFSLATAFLVCVVLWKYNPLLGQLSKGQSPPLTLTLTLILTLTLTLPNPNPP